jgi:spore germination cell wall hydrolase CwlJ-like protein
MLKWIISLIVTLTLLFPNTTQSSNIEPIYVSSISVPYIKKYPNHFENITEEKLAFIRAEQEIYCLAQNIYFEARGETKKGQQAVADVTLNRVKNKRFPSTVCKVVYYKVNRKCAFSWVCQFEDYIIKNEKAFAKAKQIAYNKYNTFKRGQKYDITNGATFYHANYVDPYWTAKKTTHLVIGSHIFYR